MADEINCPDFNSDEAGCLLNSDSCLWIEPYCTEIVESDNPLFDAKTEKTDKQIVELSKEVAESNDWTPSTLTTYGVKYLIRGKEALTWSLNIKDSGFSSEAIQVSYNKVLTIVNSMFILGLLAIAAMWMFSIIIPRKYLKKVIVVYTGAVIFVNFALPLNRLFIDGTNLLQSTLLMQDGNAIGITEIVQTPKYEDVIGYRNTSENVSSKTDLTIKPNGDGSDEDIEIGQVDAGDERAVGSITGSLESESIELSMPKQSIVLNADQSLSITQESKFNQYNEQAVFSFLLILATGTAYLILALIFVLRIVILWALLILSPVLFLLAIFRITRGWFINWLSIYGKWLFIGPLAALGIAVIVNIWQMVGLPIENTYMGDTFANNMTNIAFYLPGKETPNTLSNTGEMMEYLVFLLMLYVPIFFAFVLTRQKYVTGLITGIAEKFSKNKEKEMEIESRDTLTSEKIANKEKESVRSEKEKEGVIENMKEAINTGIAKVTETAMPPNMTDQKYRNTHVIQSASNFLPEKLELTGIHEMMELIGMDKKSRHSRGEVLEKLASPADLTNPKEQERVEAVRNEIEKRSFNGDPEAMMLMGELEGKLADMTAPFETVAGIRERNTQKRVETLKEKEINIKEGNENKKTKPENTVHSQTGHDKSGTGKKQSEDDKNTEKNKTKDKDKEKENTDIKEDKDKDKDEKAKDKDQTTNNK